MAHARTGSLNDGKNPHSVSLKVLRLSRPSLSHQHPLPSNSRDPSADGALYISPSAALAIPRPISELPGNEPIDFSITPALTLPSSFASAYVGESFACTLSANNELPEGSDKAISNVRVTAEMQTPSNASGTALEVETGSSDLAKGATDGIEELARGGSIQSIIKLDLKEEGSHILAVTITYTETNFASGSGTSKEGDQGRRSPAVIGARVRTFRKLYQFVAQQLLSVRTKTGPFRVSSKAQAQEQYVLEAQLENMGENTVCLEHVTINADKAFNSTSLNWDVPVTTRRGGPPKTGKAPLLSPRDVVQVAFLLRRKTTSGDDGTPVSTPGRIPLGQLHIQWRGQMGDRGSLSTGTLSAKV